MTQQTTRQDDISLMIGNQALLRADDHDRFLVTLHAPKAHRRGLTALYALNVEIAKTRFVVSEAALGEIRLAWWREAVADLSLGKVRRHDVLEVLSDCTLDEASTLALIEARSVDLYDEPMDDMEALITYAVNTSGQLEGIAAALMGSDIDGQVSARKVGAAWALTGMMRSLPHNLHQPAEQKWDYLPADRMADLGVTWESLKEPANRQSLCEIVAGVCDVAEHLLEDSIENQPTNGALLAVLCRSYLKALKRADYDPFVANFERGTLARFLGLAWTGLRR